MVTNFDKENSIIGFSNFLPLIKCYMKQVKEIKKIYLVFFATLGIKTSFKTHLDEKLKQRVCLKTNILKNDASTNGKGTHF
jgi:hypothetical protein